MPVTRYAYITDGTPFDCILYANNYEELDGEKEVIERFKSPEDALDVFRKGAVMSKGTTATKGLVHNYFANIFGPPQYKDLHEELAKKYFETMFDKNVFVGQLRTQLGIAGLEMKGPQISARALLDMIRTKAKDV